MRIVLLILTLCSYAAIAQARLGETHAEIARRYGTPVQKGVVIDNAGEKETGDLHEKNGFKIWVAYDNSGAAALIRFAPLDPKHPFTEDEVQRLMEVNGPERWVKDDDQSVQHCTSFHYDDPTQSRFALWLSWGETSTFELVSTGFSARRLAQKLRVENDRLSGF